MLASIKHHFPTFSALIDAPVFDVAGILLEFLVAWPDNQSRISSNIVNGWVNEYAHHDRTSVMQAICEAWGYLENNGLIAEERAQGGGPNSVFVTREGRKVKSRSGLINHGTICECRVYSQKQDGK